LRIKVCNLQTIKEQLTNEKQGQSERERIDNLLRAEKEKMVMFSHTFSLFFTHIFHQETEIYFERKSKELEIQKFQLTPEYLELKKYEEVSLILIFTFNFFLTTSFINKKGKQSTSTEYENLFWQ